MATEEKLLVFLTMDIVTNYMVEKQNGYSISELEWISDEEQDKKLIVHIEDGQIFIFENSQINTLLGKTKIITESGIVIEMGGNATIYISKKE